MSNTAIHVTDESFEQEVLGSETPLLLDFWAEWCGPCKMVLPILDELSTEYAGKVKICKMDIDANSDTPSKLGVRSIPTLMIFKGGNLESTTSGALSKAQIIEFIDNAL